MTAHDDLDRQLNDFLRDGPTELPYESFDAVRDRTDQTGQRVIIGPWRLPEMNKIVTIGLAAAAVVVAVFIGAQVFGSPDGGLGAGPTATATPEPTATLEPSPSPAPSAPPLTQSFTSTQHGISVSYPEGWTAQAANEPWEGEPFPNFGDPSADVIYHPVQTGELWLMLASMPLEASDPAQWPAEQFAATDCSSTEPLSVDGATGLIGADFDSTDCSVVFVVTGGRGYQIRLYDSNAEGAYDRAWFEEVLATVQLHPEDAVD